MSFFKISSHYSFFIKMMGLYLCIATPSFADADNSGWKHTQTHNTTAQNKHSSVKNPTSQDIVIDIDYTEGFSLERPAGQIVLGNPIIADVKVRDESNIFIIGKSPGRTNMLVYGRDGSLQARHTIIVRDPNTYLTVFSGAGNKAHYDCMPNCQRVMRIEDSGTAYEEQSQKVLSHIQQIDGQANQTATQDNSKATP